MNGGLGLVDRIGSALVLGVLYGVPCALIADRIRALALRPWRSK